jgi:hypothetical protein
MPSQPRAASIVSDGFRVMRKVGQLLDDERDLWDTIRDFLEDFEEWKRERLGELLRDVNGGEEEVR